MATSISLSPPGATFKRRLYPAKPHSQPLFQAARENPGKIDDILRPYIHDEELPSDLAVYLLEYTNIQVTPSLFGDQSPDRPRWYYANCLIFGMVLGRAYKLLSTPTRPPNSLSNPSDFPFSRLPAELRLHIYEYVKADSIQRKRLWDVMSSVFIKALWSGRDPEEGARYIAGILIVTCGISLSHASTFLLGQGSNWVWWDNKFSQPEHTWTWQDLETGILATADLPRSNTSMDAVWDKWRQLQNLEANETHTVPWPEYVSGNTLAVLDLARAHLRAGERDWTPPELVAKFLLPLFDGLPADARSVWEATGFILDVDESGATAAASSSSTT
ncbi:hypothetical protein BU24DRAFT_428583 [Aaosphaeria arxii CBS 175.79]|uniref:Uncharacterized protein n=1 Tax=Aaosphaeria arxii CBS 175.79 TaxID=1450172 RepID=A0A6A5X9Q2_9PLEO|nr:uncharacterized protein BU24DRAFT_428583 [Aaosphaeria arxii CBS 175.79]KAF2009692.1 hypothetical protein BU24DRAFT_428583 [Aaosphaeria arxii CBS 175.79]